ncbi:MAG: IPT/TIG domain-containing protein [Solirubrobacteraceae bacterium]
MARTTKRTRLTSIAVFALTLLIAALLSASASARVAGGAVPAASEDKAPKITKDPASATVEEGHSALFEASASGVPTPTVQWEILTPGSSTWSPVAGATEDRLTIASAKTSESGDDYRATFKNVAGSAISKLATLTVQNAPVVTKQPLNTTVEEGQIAVFEATASGFPTPTVQWDISTDGGSTWTKLFRATSDQLTIAGNASANGNDYRAVFSNAAGETISDTATLTVQKLPAITKQPASVTVEEGQPAAFEATASGLPTPTVQWEVSTDGGAAWSPVAGASADRLAIASAATSENGDEYRAVFTNTAGSTTSAIATLTVHKAPAVTEQPASITVELGQSAVFEAAATGFPTPTVQWEVSSNSGGTWSPVAGATADQLTVEDAQVSVNGDEYRAAFTNAAGKAISEAATLTVATHHYRVLDWGQNTYGQLGDDSFTQSDTPVVAKGLNFVTSVAAGKRHSLALLSNGTVVAWGEGASGQLGDGEEAGSAVPVEVEELTGVKAIAAGANYSLALLEDGTVMAWGGNESGQLGDGNDTGTDLPVAVKGLTGVTAIAAGGEHSLALLSDGKVVAWGQNESGQLGDGDLTDSNVPVEVKDLSGVKAIAAGGEHSLALLAGGTVMAWGADEYGQLGNSSVEETENEEGRRSELPVAVEGLSGVTAIAAGAHHSLALLANQTVMAWGEDEAGELGDGSIVRDDETPVAVSGLSGVTAIAAGGEHSMALLSSGAVDTWGENKFGELGDGSAGESSDIPVVVSGLAEAKGIAAGGSHDVVYSEPPPSITSINPVNGPAAGGTSVRITGANLEGATAVAFGANGATSFTVNSASTITATAPAGAVGTVNVTVTTPTGTSPVDPSDQFTYLPLPSVKKLSAKSGPGDGGTAVTITGANLEGATSVAFGASTTTDLKVNSAKSLTVVTPAGAGTVNVTVTTPGGTSAVSGKAQFAFTPLVEGVAPNSGPAAGGTRVTINGAGFALGAGATTFKFGKATATEVDCSSETSCTVTAPAGKAGSVEVTAEVGKGKSPADPPGDSFTYE